MNIVVDFDDTICIGSGTDISKGTPNYKLIEQLNKLYDIGYNINIYTARGHISANSRKEAKEKYYSIIQEWLNEHNVKYTLLSFQKPLAICYIDDKAIRPDELDKLKELENI